MLLSERIKNWDIAVKQLADCTGRENRGKAMCVVKGHQGPLWVALYLLHVWEQDLNTRLKVRRTLAVVPCMYTACGATCWGPQRAQSDQEYSGMKIALKECSERVGRVLSGLG